MPGENNTHLVYLKADQFNGLEQIRSQQMMQSSALQNSASGAPALILRQSAFSQQQSQLGLSSLGSSSCLFQSQHQQPISKGFDNMFKSFANLIDLNKDKLGFSLDISDIKHAGLRNPVGAWMLFEDLCAHLDKIKFGEKNILGGSTTKEKNIASLKKGLLDMLKGIQKNPASLGKDTLNKLFEMAENKNGKVCPPVTFGDSDAEKILLEIKKNLFASNQPKK